MNTSIENNKKSKEIFTKKSAREFAFMSLGSLLLAVGVYFFKIPNGFSTGGVSGISTVLGKAFPAFTPATLILVINTLLLLVGLIIFGREFGVKTIYCSLLFSGLTMLFEKLIPLTSPLTDEPLLDLICAILLTAFGSALMFGAQASGGGTDVVAMILKRYTSLDIGKSLLVTDFLIAASAFLVFPVKVGIFSLLGLFAKAFLVDGVIESIGTCKYFTIVTTKREEIAEYITKTIGHGFTELHGFGGYTGEGCYVLLTVCKRIEGARLKKFCKQVDPHSFLIVSNTSEIIGRGFRAA